jgi:hypothetical protein
MITVDTRQAERLLRAMRKNIAQAPNRFQNAMRGKGGRLANSALTKLSREPGPPIYPIRWATARQRRAYFATGGFGHGIPSRRSGTLLRSWVSRFFGDRQGGVVTLSNPISYMRYVQGDKAQPFHLDTGYVQVSDVVEDFYREAREIGAEVWLVAADPFTGVPR